MTMTKKEYIAPALMVIEMQAENMLALSFDTREYSGPEMSNKREPEVSTWSSSNWNAEEEF